MTNYSTTLPPGFTTWNELWDAHKDDTLTLDGNIIVIDNKTLIYQKDFIKARAYDEIMELAGNHGDLGVPGSEVYKQLVCWASFGEKFESLTHIKLLK